MTNEEVKLIIEIPKEDYERIKEYYDTHDIVEVIYSYIRFGIPIDDVTLKENKGDWIRNGSHVLAPVYRCSNCNKRVAIIWGEEYKCCPNCKADMRGKINPEYKFEIAEENNETDN